MRLAVAVAAVLAATAQAASAAGVRSIELADRRPGEVSRPFAFAIGQAGFDPRPDQYRVEIEGFALDDGNTPGRRIASVDYDTDQGFIPGQFVTTQGNGTYRFEIPNPATAQSMPVAVTQAKGLDAGGNPVDRAGSTLLSFTVPKALPLDARVRTLTLRFNAEGDRGPRNGGKVDTPTPDVGATNPAAPGTYAVRTWARAVDGTTEVATQTVAVDAAAPAPARLRVKRDGYRFAVRNAAGGPAAVTVRRGGKVLARLEAPATFRYRPRKADRGKRVTLAFVPEAGTPKRVSFRVPRRR